MTFDVEVEHLNDVPWIDAPLPSRFHFCRPQTTGWIGPEYFERCACGAIRERRGPWLEKNSRRRDLRRRGVEE